MAARRRMIPGAGEPGGTLRQRQHLRHASFLSPSGGGQLARRADGATAMTSGLHRNGFAPPPTSICELAVRSAGKCLSNRPNRLAQDNHRDHEGHRGHREEGRNLEGDSASSIGLFSVLSVSSVISVSLPSGNTAGTGAEPRPAEESGGIPDQNPTGRPVRIDSAAFRHIAVDHRPSSPVQGTGVPSPRTARTTAATWSTSS